MLPSMTEEYLRMDSHSLGRTIQTRSANKWDEAGKNIALKIFHAAAQRVPAYQDFLCRNGIDPATIRNYADFQAHVPPVDKPSYIDQYPLEDLMWDGDASGCTVMNSSSGTSGKTYYWPTSASEIAAASALYEHVFQTHFNIAERSTLFIICFGMGTWIAGSYTYNATQHLHQRGHRFSIVTPGFDKATASDVVRKLGPKYDQVVIAGIPSFVRDFVQDVDLSDQEIGFLLAGEGFTESWRDFVLHRVGATSADRIVSFYGAADAGLMAFETTASIEARRSIDADYPSRQKLFRGNRSPMLFQFSPTHRFFETHAGELLVTANRALPLVRYNLHDQGQILSADEVYASIRIKDCDFSAFQRQASNMPFLAVYGRGNFGATLYGANIYVEDVQNVFQDDAIASLFSGRFVVETNYDQQQLQRLDLHAEVASGVSRSDDLSRRLQKHFVQQVAQTSSEYRKILSEYGDRAHPCITLHDADNSDRFGETKQVKSS